MKKSHMFDAAEDQIMRDRNVVYHDAILNCLGNRKPRRVLDVGCHYGGFLYTIGNAVPHCNLHGTEILKLARETANSHLKANFTNFKGVRDDATLESFDEKSMDLIVGHEVMQYIENIELLAAQCHRVLSDKGECYMVLGCHSENPVWERWRKNMEYPAHSHRLIDVIKLFNDAGFTVSCKPLMPDTWITNDGDTSHPISFHTIEELLDHHHKHKIIFRMTKKYNTYE